MTKKEKLALLETVLIQSGISRRDFSLNECSDDRVCIEYNNDGWTIYMCERGHKLDVFECKDFKIAIRNFVNRLTETKKISNSIVKKYFEELSNYRENQKTFTVDVFVHGSPAKRTLVADAERPNIYLPQMPESRRKFASNLHNSPTLSGHKKLRKKIK